MAKIPPTPKDQAERSIEAVHPVPELMTLVMNAFNLAVTKHPSGKIFLRLESPTGIVVVVPLTKQAAADLSRKLAAIDLVVVPGTAPV